MLLIQFLTHTTICRTLAAVQAENAAAHAELAKVKQLYSYEQSATQKNPSTSTQVTDTDNMTPNYNNNNYTIGIPCTSQPELLQQPTSPSSSTPSLQKYIAILTSKLETAQTDATTASERLIRACEENARLSDALATLELHVIDLEKGESNWKEREEDLKSQIKKVSSENSRLHGHLHAAKEELVQLKRLLDALQHKQHGNKSMIMTTNLMSMLEDNSVDDLDGGMLAAPETVVQIEEHQVDSHGQRSCALVAASAHAATAMAMSPTKLSSHAATVHQEDLLALELLHLRNKNNELETRLSASHGAVSVVEGLSREVSALHAENTALRSAVSQSNDDALKSRRELKQVQQEAQALHHQLSDVISSLTSQSSNGSAATALPSPVKRALQAVGSRNGIKCIQPAVTASTDDVISSPGMSNHGNVRSLAHQVVDHPKLSSEGGRPYSAAAVWNHRGPPTPTSDVALVHLGRGQTADSDSSSGDMMMSELKAAMAALDGRAEATVNRENDVHAADDTQLADVFCDV